MGDWAGKAPQSEKVTALTDHQRLGVAAGQLGDLVVVSLVPDLGEVAAVVPLAERLGLRPGPADPDGELKRVILSRFSRVILVGTWEIEQEKAHKSRKCHRT